ncbi:type II secretion system minor pseudopilin GspK [Desulfovibrio sp. TomC]|uniref:type II secretion system minor pseudopilin GspK n=1 Tax=Desulfovibrio sp. TomC TaxID=1562888 RepID=UPI000573AC66|nr:type II secretion system minor pseudopilin GspK [Desulfovibrio sp. TomC]KHK01156.1 General secretion pathway protein K [Desulfovibrio sp. TomC]
MKTSETGGAVLLFVLALVALLASLAVSTTRTAQIEVFSAYGGIYSRQAQAIAESGLLAAAAMLIKDGQKRDTDNLAEDWAAFPDLATYPGVWFLDGHLDGHIDDETGKFPVNSLHPGLSGHAIYEGIFLRLLTGPTFSLPNSKAKALLAALIDWLDPDDNPGEGGGEDAFYAAALLPYRVRNNSLDTLAELLLIRGFSRDLLSGQGTRPGLLSMLTVWGSGLINVNTAPLPVLAALPANLDSARAASLALSVDAYRRDPVRHDELVSLDWLRKAGGGQNAEWPQGVLSTRSLYFSVLLIGRSGSAQRRLYAVLKREQGKQSNQIPNCKVLYRELR